MAGLVPAIHVLRTHAGLDEFRTIPIPVRRRVEQGSFVSRSAECVAGSTTVEDVDGRDVGAKQSFVACPAMTIR